MMYAEIKIKIYVDENHLTANQQIQAGKADRDMTQDHPLKAGVDDLQDVIKQIALTRFQYLGCEGIKAVNIVVE